MGSLQATSLFEIFASPVIRVSSCLFFSRFANVRNLERFTPWAPLRFPFSSHSAPGCHELG